MTFIDVNIRLLPLSSVAEMIQEVTKNLGEKYDYVHMRFHFLTKSSIYTLSISVTSSGLIKISSNFTEFSFLKLC